MATAVVRSPAEYEDRLGKYMFERSEEARAVRVGEKETSEQAAIVARYEDLFSRGQLEALREAEAGAAGDERERLYRLRKTCEGGLITNALVERYDEFENRILAARVTFRGEEMPLRTAQAQLALLTEYARSRGAGPGSGRGERRVQRRPAGAAERGRGARGRVLRDRCSGGAERGGEGHLAP